MSKPIYRVSRVDILAQIQAIQDMMRPLYLKQRSAQIGAQATESEMLRARYLRIVGECQKSLDDLQEELADWQKKLQERNKGK